MRPTWPKRRLSDVLACAAAVSVPHIAAHMANMNEHETPQKPAAVKVLIRSEVATILGIAPKTLANWHSAGIGPPAMRLHSLVRYDEADFIAWYKACPSTFL